MLIRDTSTGYGLATRLMHWLMAVAIVAMFALGVWMVTLDYYHPYYHRAPDIHRSVGMLLLFVLVVRFLWRVVNVRPDDHELSPFEASASRVVHWGFYPLLLAVMVSGYLISTAEGKPVDVFGWFSVPALVTGEGQEDWAGEVHEILAYGTMALVALHTIAALKHHFVDRSRILTRMWSGPPAA
jgi:cytochrome b561